MNNKLKMTLFYSLSTVLIVYFGGSIIYGFIKEKREQDRAEYIESLNPTELLVYEVKKAEENEDFIGMKDLIETYFIKESERDLNIFNNSLKSEDFDYVTQKYNTALNQIYFIENDDETYNLDEIIKNLNTKDAMLEDGFSEYSKIIKEIVNNDVSKKLFTEEYNQIKIAYDKKMEEFSAELDKEIEEKKIYDFMEDTFNQLTNYGDTYVPEIHDPQVAELAAREFGITAEKANAIYTEIAMNMYR